MVFSSIKQRVVFAYVCTHTAGEKEPSKQQSLWLLSFITHCKTLNKHKYDYLLC